MMKVNLKGMIDAYILQMLFSNISTNSAWLHNFFINFYSLQRVYRCSLKNFSNKKYLLSKTKLEIIQR